ncbi:hypothetical protein ElyMa_005865900 [Elysia marginata]|uniref:Uncharacterized protein n=1 Tax=Elysia marginata TaxID=1093978 RepID=A0AAV4G2F7_9GAST|nr:hypothetical protein ElyMa_005865900 [Elysia marginata]
MSSVSSQGDRDDHPCSEELMTTGPCNTREMDQQTRPRLSLGLARLPRYWKQYGGFEQSLVYTGNSMAPSESNMADLVAVSLPEAVRLYASW